MNKLFKCLSTAFLGVALAVGVGVGVAQGNKSGEVSAGTVTSTTFNSKAWGDTNKGWTSDKDAYQYSSPNVQVTSAYSGAGATSKKSFENISSIKITALTTSKGVGNITVKVGEGSAQTICTLSKNTTATEYTLNYSPNVSGNVSFVVNCSTNSLYVRSISITTETTKTVDSIAVTTTPTKTTYYQGDTLDTTGIVVTATYDDSSKDDVTKDCTFSPTTLSTVGTQTITVTHTSTKTTTFDVTVNEQRTMTGIELHGSLTKTEYVVGQNYDITGLEIQVNWSVGDPSYVQFSDSGVTYILDPTVASLGDTSFNLFAEYESFEINEDLDVTVVPLSVSLSRKNGKNNFLTTSTFSFGGTITATWNDALVETIDENTDTSTLRDTNGLSYRLYEKSSSSSYISIEIGDNMSIEYNEYYVGVVYHEVVANKYKINVTEPVDFSKGAFYKVTEKPIDYSGSYILVASPSSSNNYAFTGIDASTTGITSVSITNNVIEYNVNLGIVTFELYSEGYSIYIENGDNATKYIGRETNSNGLDYSVETAYQNTISWEDAGTVKISGSAGPVFLFNNNSLGSGGQRFRYYKDKTSSTTGYCGIYLFKFMTNQNKAEEYATDFNNANVCGTTDDTPAIASVWAEQKTAWGKLSNGAKSLLTNGTATGTEVAQCLERYDTAVAKAIVRGTSASIDNFMNRTVSVGSASIFSSIETNNSIVFIVVISLVSLTAVGGYFFVRRRKETQ